jgi:hypothetical protein
MRRFQQIAPGIGLLLFGCTAAAVVVQGCQPGKLCDKEEYTELCDNPQLGGTGGGGTGGGGTGGGGAGGNRDGGGMEALKTVTRDTPVADCPTEFNTVGKMDNFFAMRCGPDGSSCHLPAFDIAWRDFKSADVWMRMAADTTRTTVCAGSRIIDNRNWANSLMLAKVKDPVACPPGSTGNAGLRMPPANMAPMMDPLSPAELKCLENFVRAATGN